MSQLIESSPRAFRKGVEYLKKGKKDKGVNRLATALKDGFKPAMVLLDLAQHENDINQLITSFEQLMEQGFSHASLAIGRLYYNGVNRQLSRETSVKWFLESARDGGIEACNYIGEMRENGD